MDEKRHKAMIHDEIVTFEVAKLAKEKGFREMANCYQGYRKDGTLFYFSNIPDGKERVMQTDCLAPTQSLLQRWLREEKGVTICVDIFDDGWFFDISTFHKQDTGVYEVEIPYKSSNVSPVFDTYELALEDALKYALENLV